MAKKGKRRRITHTKQTTAREHEYEEKKHNDVYAVALFMCGMTLQRNASN